MPKGWRRRNLTLDRGGKAVKANKSKEAKLSRLVLELRDSEKSKSKRSRSSSKGQFEDPRMIIKKLAAYLPVDSVQDGISMVQKPRSIEKKQEKEEIKTTEPTQEN